MSKSKGYQIPATLIHTVNNKRYRLNGTLLNVNESAGTCTMKFGKYINENIPSSEVYLNERVYDELVKAGKFIWNKIKNIVKSVKGFIFPVNEKGQELEQFINIPANVVTMALPASVDYCPSDATIELAEEYDMEVIQDKTMDEALDDAIRRENKEITTYWTRVIKEYQKPKNESLTISDTVKLVNEKYYHRTVNTSNVLNEAGIPSLRNLVKGGYGEELSAKELVDRIYQDLLLQLEPISADQDTKPCLIWGAPGIGKTSIIKRAANLLKDDGYNLDMVVMKCGALKHDDFELPDTVINKVGDKFAISVPKTWLPVFSEGGLTKDQIAKMDEYYNSGAYKVLRRSMGLTNVEETNDDGTGFNGGIIFFDEFARMRPEVSTIMMNLMGERTYGEMRLASRWTTIAAANRLSDDFRSETDSAFRTIWDGAKIDRYKHYTFVPSKKDWLVWAREEGPDGRQNIDEMICAFIEHMPDYVWYDALDLGSRDDVPHDVKSALANVGSMTSDQVSTIGNYLESVEDSTERMRLDSWTPRTWDQKVNSIIFHNLKNILFRNDEEAYENCFEETVRERDIHGYTTEEYSVKNISLAKLSAELNKVSDRVWAKWTDGKWQKIDPNQNLRKSNRIQFFKQWIGEIVISDAVGVDNKPVKAWKEYNKVKTIITVPAMHNIWKTGRISTSKAWQKDDNITYEEKGNYVNTSKSFWKDSNPGEIFSILSDIIKNYPGGAFKFDDIEVALRDDANAFANKAFEKAIEKDIKAYIDKPVKTTLADVAKWDKVYSEDLFFPNTNKVETVHFLFSDRLEMDDEVKLNICNILNNSEVARQLANLAMFIGKIGLQISSQTVSSKFSVILEDMLATNMSKVVEDFYNSSDDSDNKYFYLGAPAIKIFEIAKEYWITV